MTAWTHLFKKEFRNGLPFLLFALVSLLVFLVLAIIFGVRSGHVPEAILIAMAIYIGPHTAYLFFYMLFSLQREKKKLHLWLHNPMSAGSLLLAKFLNGLLAMTVTLFISCAIALVTYISLGDVTFFEDTVPLAPLIRMGIVALIHIYLFAIDFAIWVMFFWVFYHVLVRRIGTFTSGLSTLVLFGVISYLFTRFERTGLYNTLTHWGLIPLDSFISGIPLSSGNSLNNFHLFFGTYLFEAVIAVILYFTACFLLDRKVEV